MPELEKPAIAGPDRDPRLGEHTSEVVVLVGGEAVFARTALARYRRACPRARHALARELRQTFAAWRSAGRRPAHRPRTSSGSGAAAAGRRRLPLDRARRQRPPAARAAHRGHDARTAPAELPRFAKALALALGLAGRARGHEPAPRRRSRPSAATRSCARRSRSLSGLAAVIAVSFGFSTIAELRALDAEHEMLAARLGAAVARRARRGDHRPRQGQGADRGRRRQGRRRPDAARRRLRRDGPALQGRPQGHRARRRRPRRAALEQGRRSRASCRRWATPRRSPKNMQGLPLLQGREARSARPSTPRASRSTSSSSTSSARTKKKAKPAAGAGARAVGAALGLGEARQDGGRHDDPARALREARAARAAAPRDPGLDPRGRSSC